MQRARPYISPTGTTPLCNFLRYSEKMHARSSGCLCYPPSSFRALHLGHQSIDCLSIGGRYSTRRLVLSQPPSFSCDCRKTSFPRITLVGARRGNGAEIGPAKAAAADLGSVEPQAADIGAVKATAADLGSVDPTVPLPIPQASGRASS